MSTRTDPLMDAQLRPDRLHFATGVMLDREDFQAEQLYHRGRLARALALLFGTGTVAGLRVEIEPQPDGDELVRVHPGAAIDRLGRMVEIPRSACMRLGRWLKHLAEEDEDALAAARYFPSDKPAEGADTTARTYRDPNPVRTQAPEADDLPQSPVPGQPGPGPAADRGEGEGKKAEWTAWSSYLVADVFLRFAPCERGKTPAFATGPFDALDAVAPSRVRDGYELFLVPRAHTHVPTDAWRDVSAAGVEARARAAQRVVLDRGWKDAVPNRDDRDQLPPLDEHPLGVDPSSVFLARLFVPLNADADGRDAAARVLVNNHLRRFAYPGPALAWLARQ